MTKLVSVKLEEEDVKFLKQYAKKHGLVFSSFIVSILLQAVKKYKGKSE